MAENYVITIARGYGSGGKTIGKLLAEELGINYYDRDLIKLASEESGIHEKLFGAADERIKLSAMFRKGGNPYKDQLISPESDKFISNDNLFNYQAKIIKELADKESCIIIGRCADYILKDRPNVIRVFVYAPFEDCVKRLEKDFGNSRKEAEKDITSIDSHRRAYYKYYTGREWNNAENYELCLNSAQLGMEQCVKIIHEYLKIRCE